jgi:TolB-like protein
MKISLSLIVLLVVTVATRAQEGPQTVVVMPFNALGTTETTNAIGISIQQVLAAELSRMKAIQPAAPTVAGPVTIESATKAANDARANLVIYGSYHVHERDLRITGQILDVRSNRFIGSLKMTGSSRDLFAVQDVIVQQARRIIAARVTPPPPPTTTPPPETDGSLAEPEPLIEPLGPVPAVWAWNQHNPVVDRARDRIANQHDYDRVTYAYRNTYGFAPLLGFNLGYTYPYYPHIYYRYRRHHHHH